MNTPGPWRLVAGLLSILLTLPASASGQVADPKTGFAEAVAQFGLALEGSYGDEGPRVLAALDALDRGLARWDDTIRSYERAMEAETKNAEPGVAALAHLALGGVYLDRRRVSDALREFTVATQLDPKRIDAFTLLGVANSPPFPANAAAAIAALQKTTALDPEDVVSEYLLARELSRAGKAEDAARSWRRVADKFRRRMDERAVATGAPFMRFGIVDERSGVEPFFPPAIYADGFALLARGEYSAALASLRSSSSRDPLVADEANRYGMRRAADAFRDGAIDAAIEQLQAAIELAPQRAEPHRILGLVWAADEQFDRGADELKAAVKLNPDDERARMALADVLVRAGRVDAAEDALRETIARLPESGRAHYVLARLLQRKGEQVEALKAFQACLVFNPLVGLNGIYQSMGAIAAARQNFDVAIDAYSKRVDSHPNDSAAHQDLGDTYARLSRSDEALAEFAVALTIDPNRAPAYASLAQLHLRQGQHDEAVNAANRALALDASQPQTHYALGTALMRLGKADEGEKELKEFERLQQKAAADRARDLELGRIRREAQLSSSSGEHEKAASLLRRALELVPDDPIASLNLGMALMLAGKPAEAIAQYTAAVTLKAPSEVHLRMAEAYAALGRAEDSRREQEIYEQLMQDRLQRAGAPR
jgi:tetratricopeptide (TPR) repeat protein